MIQYNEPKRFSQQKKTLIGRVYRCFNWISTWLIGKGISGTESYVLVKDDEKLQQWNKQSQKLSNTPLSSPISNDKVFRKKESKYLGSPQKFILGVICCLFSPQLIADVVLHAGEEHRINVQLSEDGQFSAVWPIQPLSGLWISDKDDPVAEAYSARCDRGTSAYTTNAWSSDNRYYGRQIAPDVIVAFDGYTDSSLLGAGGGQYTKTWNSNGTATYSAPECNMPSYYHMNMRYGSETNQWVYNNGSFTTKGTLIIYAGPKSFINGQITKKLGVRVVNPISWIRGQTAFLGDVTIEGPPRQCTVAVTPNSFEWPFIIQRDDHVYVSTKTSQLSIRCQEGSPTDPISVNLTFKASNLLYPNSKNIMYLLNKSGKPVGGIELSQASGVTDEHGNTVPDNQLSLMGSPVYKLTGTSWDNLTTDLTWRLHSLGAGEERYLGVGSGSVKITVDWP
ncbi:MULTISPECIES: hypothetical protein [Providencia]|uniref:hypothetical protein n=1 Tax=Providencia TaxID=586 RepID=UPI0024B04915